MTNSISCLIAGYPSKKLSESDFRSRSRISVYAFGMLLIMSFNTVSAYFFCRQVLETNFPVAIVGVLLVVVLSFMLERIIIHTTKSWASFIFRFLLSLLTAIIFSTGVDLSLSANDIQKKVSQRRDEEARKVETKVDSLYREQFEHFKEELSEKQANATKKDSIAYAEADHPRRPGIDKIYAEKRKQADTAQAELARVKVAFLELQNTIRTEKMRRIEAFKKAPVGPWEKLSALHDIVLDGSWTTFIYLCLFLLFMCFDLTVLFTKTFGSETAYEHRTRLLEEALIKSQQQLSPKYS